MASKDMPLQQSTKETQTEKFEICCTKCGCEISTSKKESQDDDHGFNQAEDEKEKQFCEDMYSPNLDVDRKEVENNLDCNKGSQSCGDCAESDSSSRDSTDLQIIRHIKGIAALSLPLSPQTAEFQLNFQQLIDFNSKDTFCQVSSHYQQDKVIELFCDECDRVLCSLCEEAHQFLSPTHNARKLEDVGKHLLKKIKHHLNSVETLLDKVNESKAILESHRDKIAAMKLLTLKTVDKAFNERIEALDTELDNLSQASKYPDVKLWLERASFSALVIKKSVIELVVDSLVADIKEKSKVDYSSQVDISQLHYVVESNLKDRLFPTAAVVGRCDAIDTPAESATAADTDPHGLKSSFQSTVYSKSMDVGPNRRDLTLLAVDNENLLVVADGSVVIMFDKITFHEVHRATFGAANSVINKMIVHEDMVYLATNNGLLVIKHNKGTDYQQTDHWLQGYHVSDVLACLDNRIAALVGVDDAGTLQLLMLKGDIVMCATHVSPFNNVSTPVPTPCLCRIATSEENSVGGVFFHGLIFNRYAVKSLGWGASFLQLEFSENQDGDGLLLCQSSSAVVDIFDEQEEGYVYFCFFNGDVYFVRCNYDVHCCDFYVIPGEIYDARLIKTGQSVKIPNCSSVRCFTCDESHFYLLLDNDDSECEMMKIPIRKCILPLAPYKLLFV